MPADPQEEIRALDWDIVLTRDAAKAYRGDKKAMRDFGERQAKAKKWFRRPDPNYFTFSSWLDALLDQVFVYDALSLYMCPVQRPGYGQGAARVGPGFPVADRRQSYPALDRAARRGTPHRLRPRTSSTVYGVPRSRLHT